MYHRVKNRFLCLICLAAVLLLGLSAPAKADVAIDAAVFPDPNFRQYILDAGFDADGNGALSETELAAVEAIDCSGMSISDLTGIRYFTGLTALNLTTALSVPRFPFRTARPPCS